MLLTTICLIFIALLCALIGTLTLVIVRSHLSDPDFLGTQWEKYEQSAQARGQTPERTPEWESQTLRGERMRRFSAFTLLLLSAIIVFIAISVARGGAG